MHTFWFVTVLFHHLRDCCDYCEVQRVASFDICSPQLRFSHYDCRIMFKVLDITKNPPQSREFVDLKLLPYLRVRRATLYVEGRSQM